MRFENFIHVSRMFRIMKSSCFLLSLACCLFCSAFVACVSAQTPSTSQGQTSARSGTNKSRAANADSQPANNQEQASQDEDVIRINTDLTNLLFTATDKQNHFITSLRAEDIRVLEDGVPQKISSFERETDRLLSIAILIDVSASEEQTLPDEKAAARSFVEKIVRSRKDEVALIAFTGDAFLEQPLTGNVISIYQAFERVDVALPEYLGSGKKISGLPSGPGIGVPREGSTAIWDAIAVTAHEILAPSGDKKRRAIILLTDGQDTSSRLKRSTAIDEAIRDETVIYAIGIGDSKHFEGVDKDALRTLSERTGGRAFFPKKGAGLEAAFEQIEQELRSQYLVTYSSSNKKRDGAYRKLSLEIVNPELRTEELRLTYRPGYFAKGKSK
jgi:Ca-activated chloride channel family protein